MKNLRGNSRSGTSFQESYAGNCGKGLCVAQDASRCFAVVEAVFGVPNF